MRRDCLTAAIVAASLSALCVPASAAEETDQQQAAPAAGQAGSVADPTAGTEKIVLPYQDVQGVLGKEVRSATGEDMGRIVDVLVDQSGRVRAAVIDFGGFLGVGSRKVVVDWAALRFSPAEQRDRITLDLTRNQIKQAPEYKDGKPVVVVGALGAMAPGM
jgi:hypothetical protein